MQFFQSHRAPIEETHGNHSHKTICNYSKVVPMNNIVSLGKELSIALVNCQSDIADCDSASLVQRQKMLQNLQNMDGILGDMIGNYECGMQSSTANDFLEETKTDRRQRIKQTDQTIRLIQYLLEHPQVFLLLNFEQYLL